MGSICFSAATILRCTYLTPLQTIALVIPTVLEVLCSSSLIFKHKSSGRCVIFFLQILFLAKPDQFQETLAAYRRGMDLLAAFGVANDI